MGPALTEACGFAEQMEHRSLSAKLAMMCLEKVRDVDMDSTINVPRQKVLFDEGAYNNFTIMVRHNVEKKRIAAVDDDDGVARPSTTQEAHVEPAQEGSPRQAPRARVNL